MGGDMSDLTKGVDKQLLLSEATRCLKCKVAKCKKACPIATTLRGLFAVDEYGMTNIPGVFAAGDVVSGPKTVVEAVAYTKKVAEQITNYCYQKNKKEGKV